MANGIRKYIIKSKNEAIKKLKEIGPENVRCVTGIHTAWNPATNETTKYYTIHYNKRAEIEISVPVMNWFIEKEIFTIDE